MTVYQLRNKINNLKQQITDCENGIRKCQSDREYRENILVVVQNKRDTLKVFAVSGKMEYKQSETICQICLLWQEFMKILRDF